MIILGGLLTANGACTKTGKSSSLVSTHGKKSILSYLATNKSYVKELVRYKLIILDINRPGGSGHIC